MVKTNVSFSLQSETNFVTRLLMSRSILAVKKAFWPESGWILAMSGCKYSYRMLQYVMMV